MKRFYSILVLIALVASGQVQAATLSRQNIGDLALEATYANAGGSGDVAPNVDGKTVLHAKNPGGSSATVTVTAQVTSVSFPGYGTFTRSSVVASLAAGEEAFLGPFPVTAFNNSSGQLAITYGGAGAADVDVAALKLP